MDWFEITLLSVLLIILGSGLDRARAKIKQLRSDHEIQKNAFEQHKENSRKAIHALNKAVTGLNDNLNRVQKELGIKTAASKIMQRGLTRLKQNANTRKA